ncbi:hypothetical protein TNCV_1137781 [Trichonephila clavipes]|nr:hypothetical protein TNCV_1137781 [Trichonephila clavipes]
MVYANASGTHILLAIACDFQIQEASLLQKRFVPSYSLQGAKRSDVSFTKRHCAGTTNGPKQFQECDENVGTRMACNAEDSGFQTQNDKIVTAVQEEYGPVDKKVYQDEDNSKTESSKDP